MVAKKPVSVKAILEDIRAGRSKDEIMSRHELSKRGLKSLFMKMNAAGYLEKSDVDRLRKSSAKRGKRKVSAKEVLGDIKAGLTDAGLMKKYGLSIKGLDALFARLLKERLVTEGDLFTRGSQLHGTVDILPSRRGMSPSTDRTDPDQMSFRFRCPQCRSLEVEDYTVCPRCGFKVAEFNAKHSAKQKESKNSRDENRKGSKNETAAQQESATCKVEIQAGEMTILRKALEAGIFTVAEYAAKREELILRNGSRAAIRALDDLLKAGLVSEEEFELKRSELSERSVKFDRLKQAFENGILSETDFKLKRAALIRGESQPQHPKASPRPHTSGMEGPDAQPAAEEGAFAGPIHQAHLVRAGRIDPNLLSGEKILGMGEIIFAPWFLTVFGQMKITDKRVLFTPHRWAVWLAAVQSVGIGWLANKVPRESLDFSISRIQSVSRKTFLGIFQGLVLRMRSGIEHRFLFCRRSASGGEELLTTIEGIIHKR